MKQSFILAALGIQKPIKQERDHAKTLEQIYAMISEVSENITSISSKVITWYFGRETYWTGGFNGFQAERNKGIEMPFERWIITTKNGKYSIVIPGNQEILNKFKSLVPSFFPEVDQERKGLVFDAELMSSLKTAISFAGLEKDAAHINQVWVKMDGCKIQFISTDGKKLFQSVRHCFESEKKDFGLPIEQLKKAMQINSKELILKLTAEGGCMNGIEFKKIEQSFPNYVAVIPDYPDFIEADRKELIRTVKAILPYAIKTWNSQMRLYFNGCIEVSAKDIYFGHECKDSIPYLKKRTKDFEIWVNGENLLTVLQASKERNVKIYSNGDAKKCLMFDQGILLMPVMQIEQ